MLCLKISFVLGTLGKKTGYTCVKSVIHIVSNTYSQ